MNLDETPPIISGLSRAHLNLSANYQHKNIKMEYIPFMELLFLAEDIHGRTKIIIKNHLDMGELF